MLLFHFLPVHLKPNRKPLSQVQIRQVIDIDSCQLFRMINLNTVVSQGIDNMNRR